MQYKHTLTVTFEGLKRPQFRLLKEHYRKTLGPNFLFADSASRQVIFRFATVEQRDKTREVLQAKFQNMPGYYVTMKNNNHE